MGMTVKSAAAFYNLPKRASRPDINHVMVGPLGVRYASDGCLCARTSAFPIAVEEYAQPSDASITQFLKSWFDPVDRSDGIIVASTPKAQYHGEGRPIIRENLRAYARFTKKLERGVALYPLGDTLVNAARLADALDIVPDAQVVVPPTYLMNPLKPVLLIGAFAEVALMPVLFSLYTVAKMLEPLAAYQAETGEYGANAENPFYSIRVPKNKED